MVSHAELLAKTDTLEAKYTDYPTYLAFRAVVELHKPQASSFDDDECAACSNAELSITYPCETIKVIEKELM
jgi:hypothetical protein